MKINIASNEVVHFIGIGGIGMSGLAQIMKNTGFIIQGSDSSRNKNTERLIKLGIKVYFGHHQKHLKKATMIVVSSAMLACVFGARTCLSTLCRTHVVRAGSRQSPWQSHAAVGCCTSDPLFSSPNRLGSYASCWQGTPGDSVESRAITPS